MIEPLHARMADSTANGKAAAGVRNMLLCRSIMTRYQWGILLFVGFISFSAVFFSVAGVHAQTTDEEAITNLLTAQAAAWNQGDIGAFMDSYENSADTAYVGAEPVKGYNAILERYRSRYPDRATMGRLSFSELDVRLVAPNVAIVVGRFALARAPEAGGPASGIFTLVTRKSGTAWKIIHDHTS